MISDLFTITGRPGRAARTIFFGCVTLSAVAQAAGAVLLLPLLTALFGPHPAEAWPWVAALAGCLLVALACDSVSVHAGLRLGFILMRAVERAGVRGIQSLDLAHLHGERAARLREFAASKGTEVVSASVLLVTPLVQSLLIVPLISLMLLPVAWQLTVVGLVGGVVLYAALQASQAAVARSEAEYENANRELEDSAAEFAWAQTTLRAAGVKNATLARVAEQTRSRGLRLLLWSIPGELLFTVVLQAILIVFGGVIGWLYLNADLSGIEAAALVVVLLRIVDATGALSLLSVPLAAGRETLRFLRELMAEHAIAPVAVDRRGYVADEDGATEAGADAPLGGPEADPAPAAPAVALRGVTAGYPGGKPVLSGLSLELPAGQCTVIVGASGSGKSTLLDVIAGLRAPAHGEVSFAGQTLPAPQRAAQTAALFQSTELRSGSLRRVIAADQDPESVDWQTLAEHAQLGGLLETLPDGWDSALGQTGSNLSGGEKQRIGLARALAKPASVLILDEPTSALDATTEATIATVIGQFKGSRTTIVVTHRPALIAAADYVVVLDDGRVSEAGPIDSVRDSGGAFAQLWQRWQEAESLSLVAGGGQAG